jgi:DNA-binding PadR family transcriptional regulator
MPRSNKTEFAVLGLLSIQPMSGYDMRKFVAYSLSFFWQESYGQLYPTLRRLLARRLVSRSVEPAKGKPDRHVYRLTAAGRKRLASWLKEDAKPESVRIELLLKLFFGTSGRPPRQIEQLDVFLLGQKEKLARLDRVASEKLKPYEGTPDYPYWFATLRYGVLLTQARIVWGEETLNRLRSAARKG